MQTFLAFWQLQLPRLNGHPWQLDLTPALQVVGDASESAHGGLVRGSNWRAAGNSRIQTSHTLHVPVHLVVHSYGARSVCAACDFPAPVLVRVLRKNAHQLHGPSKGARRALCWPPRHTALRMHTCVDGTDPSPGSPTRLAQDGDTKSGPVATWLAATAASLAHGSAYASRCCQSGVL